MLINRKRSARRGPKYSQTYVPHDQRRINTQPTPIMDEKTAQYYYNQLLTMGYINPNPYIVVIKNKDPAEHVAFEINDDMTLGSRGNISALDMKIVDIYGEPYKTPIISNEDIINRVGVKLYPIMAKGSLGVYNAVDSVYDIYFMDQDTSGSGSHVTKTVQPHSYMYFSDFYPYFDSAGISTSGSYMYYNLRKPLELQGQYDLMYCYYHAFYLVCDELAVLVYPA